MLRSLVRSCDLEKRDPLGYEIETGPFCRYDPTDNPQDATSTSDTNYNVTNSCSLLFLLLSNPRTKFCCYTGPSAYLDIKLNFKQC